MKTRFALSLALLLCFTVSHGMAQDDEGALKDAVKALKSKDDSAAQSAIETLSKRGKPALTHVAPLLEHPNNKVRRRAAKVVGLISLRARREVEEAKERLRKAIAALDACQESYEKVEAQLSDKNSDVRAEAAVTLGLVVREKNKERAAKRLSEALGDKNNKVRTGAAMGLAFIGRKSAVAVEMLRRTLKDKNSKCRAASAKALGAIGPKASAALGELEAAKSDKNSAVRKAAAEAVEKIKGE